MSMLRERIESLRELHERAKRGQLEPDARTLYDARRDELARVVLAAQRLTVRPGESPRQVLRIARALKVDLTLPTGKHNTITLDLSAGGFSAVLPVVATPGHVADFVLAVAAERIGGSASVVSSGPHHTTFRASFRIESISSAHRERLEIVIFDSVLGSLKI